MSNGNAELVRSAFRLGWGVSELRGRCRPELFNEPTPKPVRTDGWRREEYRQIPLGAERSPDEVRIETIRAVRGLAGAVGVKSDSGVAHSLTRVTGFVYELTHKQPGESDAQRDARVRTSWDDDDGIQIELYKLDAQIQDALAVQGSQAAAYQLGRGLADTYWGLDRTAPEEQMGSWNNVLGVQRRKTLERQAARLSPEIGPLVLAAVGGPLEQWCELAAAPARRQPPADAERTAEQAADEVLADLYLQGLMWRDLIRGERQPGDLDQPDARDVWRDLSLYSTVFKTLRLPIILGLLAAGLLITGAALLAGNGASKSLSTVLSIVGGLGITSAGLYARAKSDLTSVFRTVRERVDLERVRRGASTCPQLPKPVRTRRLR
jgi:hypothetical protein